MKTLPILLLVLVIACAPVNRNRNQGGGYSLPANPTVTPSPTPAVPHSVQKPLKSLDLTDGVDPKILNHYHLERDANGSFTISDLVIEQLKIEKPVMVGDDDPKFAKALTDLFDGKVAIAAAEHHDGLPDPTIRLDLTEMDGKSDSLRGAHPVTAGYEGLFEAVIQYAKAHTPSATPTAP